jgi:3-methyladenine DNA glycosylase/8-oxoguanine DNA glycosylase
MPTKNAIYNVEPTSADGSDHNAAIAHLRRRDRTLRRIIDEVGPCRLAPQKGHFMALCEAIMSQQLAVAAAATIFRRFRALFPRQTPTPARLLEMPEADLRAAGLSTQKIKYVRDLAARFVDGTVPYRRLARMDDEAVIQALTKVNGVGVWTAHMFLIFVLNRPDVWPVDDLGIRRAVQIQFKLAELPAAEELTSRAARWRPYRSIAAWYLWQSLGNKPMG